MIEVTGLRKSFGALEVLKGVSFEVRKGNVLVVLGPSGSGKSTMLRCTNLLEEYKRGEIRIEGEPVGYRTDCEGRRIRLPEGQNAALRAKVGMVFQGFNLFPHRTACPSSDLALRLWVIRCATDMLFLSRRFSRVRSATG